MWIKERRNSPLSMFNFVYILVYTGQQADVGERQIQELEDNTKFQETHLRECSSQVHWLHSWQVVQPWVLVSIAFPVSWMDSLDPNLKLPFKTKINLLYGPRERERGGEFHPHAPLHHGWDWIFLPFGREGASEMDLIWFCKNKQKLHLLSTWDDAVRLIKPKRREERNKREK